MCSECRQNCLHNAIATSNDSNGKSMTVLGLFTSQVFGAYITLLMSLLT